MTRSWRSQASPASSRPFLFFLLLLTESYLSYHVVSYDIGLKDLVKSEVDKEMKKMSM